MAEIVVEHSSPDEALPVHHAALGRIGRIQIRVIVDSAVDHRDADAAPIQTVTPGSRGAHGGGRIVERSAQRPVQRDVSHVRLIRHCQYIGRMQRRRYRRNQRKDGVQYPADQIQHSTQQPAQKPSGRLRRRRVVLHDYVDLVGRIRQQRLQVRRDLGIIREGLAGQEQKDSEKCGSHCTSGIRHDAANKSTPGATT